MLRTDRQCLEDIIVAVHRIQDYVGELDYSGFVANRMLLDAVERNLITIGEAASRLSENVRILEPTVEWGLATGMRNIVVYKYFGVDYQIVWDVVSNELLSLVEAAQRILAVDQ